MNKKLHFIVSIFCALCWLNLKAQITITEADLPNTWTLIVTANDTTPDASLLSQVALSGPNQTWNLTAIQNEQQDTMQFMDPAQTPFASSFPTANLSELDYEDTIPTYVYFKKTSSYFNLIGVATPYDPDLGDTIILPFTDPQTLLEMPFTYPNTFTDTSCFQIQLFFGQMGIDSVRTRIYTYKNNTADGWGTLTTTAGTYNVIRIKEQNIEIDSTWFYMFGEWELDIIFNPPSIDTSYNYSWLANSQGFPVAEIELNATQDTITRVSYLIYTNANVPEITEANNLFSVYPNPAQDYIIICHAELVSASFVLYDLLGKEVKQSVIPSGARNLTIRISDLSKGLYLYRTLDKNGRELNKGKIIIE